MPTKDGQSCSHKLVRFSNCTLLRNHQIICDDLWVRDGKILNPEKVFFDERIRADVIVDCCGLLIVPGFIDVQINGTVHNFVILPKQKEVYTLNFHYCLLKISVFLYILASFIFCIILG